MTWFELRNKCKRDSDYIITLFITNEVSLVLTWVLLKTRITPNQVTLASVFCGLLCGIFYAFGLFLIGSIFLFLAHALDCTDGNLARAKELFNSFGRWLDLVGDRTCEIFIFLGVSIYLYRNSVSGNWSLLTLLVCIMLLLYYYIVDIGLAIGISTSKQKITRMKFKDVSIKWGLLEPVLYGFIILAPLGLLKLQIILVLIVTLFGIAYQILKIIKSKDV